MNPVAAGTWLSPPVPVASLSSSVEDLRTVLRVTTLALWPLASMLVGDWYPIRLNIEVMANFCGSLLWWSCNPPFPDQHSSVPSWLRQLYPIHFQDYLPWEGRIPPTIPSLSSMGHYYREHKARRPKTPTEISEAALFLFTFHYSPSLWGWSGQHEQCAQAWPSPNRFLDPSESRLLPHPLPTTAPDTQMHLSWQSWFPAHQAVPPGPWLGYSLMRDSSVQAVTHRLSEYFSFCSTVRSWSHAAHCVKCSLSSGWDFGGTS